MLLTVPDVFAGLERQQISNIAGWHRKERGGQPQEHCEVCFPGRAYLDIPEYFAGF
jgi:hypothetical protein